MEFSDNYKNNALILQESTLKIGWCLVEDLRSKSFLHPQIDRKLPFAISIAYPLSKAVIDTVRELPTLIYQEHYRAVNRYLEALALELTRRIQIAGYQALPAPVTLSISPLKGHLSHKVAAVFSGLGWIGKSGLLVTPDLGARVRLVTVFTDLPLPDPKIPMGFGCGDCAKCIDICPVNAISHDPLAFRRDTCYKYILTLVKKGIVQEHICGQCVRVCDGNIPRFK